MYVFFVLQTQANYKHVGSNVAFLSTCVRVACEQVCSGELRPTLANCCMYTCIHSWSWLTFTQYAIYAILLCSSVRFSGELWNLVHVHYCQISLYISLSQPWTSCSLRPHCSCIYNYGLLWLHCSTATAKLKKSGIYCLCAQGRHYIVMSIIDFSVGVICLLFSCSSLYHSTIIIVIKWKKKDCILQELVERQSKKLL